MLPALRKLLCCLCLCSLLTMVKAKDFLITRYGAKPGLANLNTIAINKAITACYQAGGGRVVIPAGIFRSGTLLLKDHVELYLSMGAVLLASETRADFPLQPTPAYRSQKDSGGWRALIYASGASHIAITGLGAIDGNGAKQEPGPDAPVKSDLDGRPRNLLFISCNNIRVEGIHMQNSGIWNQHYLDCEDVLVDGITVFNHANRNNDGIDIDGCRRFTLSNSTFDTDDDAIVIKSTGAAATEDLVITNCIVSSFCNAIKAGTESTGGFRNITISNCVVKPSRNTGKLIFGSRKGITGISLEMVDGGVMEGVSISNITIEGTDCPLYMRLGNRARKHIPEAPEPPVGRMRNIVLSNIVAYNTGNYCSSITGIPGHYVENVSLSNIQLHNEGGLTSGQYIDEVKRVVEDEKGYPQPTVWKNLPSSGLFIRHAKNIQVHGLMLGSQATDPRTPVMAVDVDGLQIRSTARVSNSSAQVFFQGYNVTNTDIETPLGWHKPVTAMTEPVKEVDVCIYGGTSAGVIAAYSAAKMGKKVLLIEPGKHLGGLTAGGLGYTDIGNKYAISGIALDFYRRLGRHYGNFEQWVFEPSVAAKTFREYIEAAQVPVQYACNLKEVRKENNRIREIVIGSTEGAGKHEVIKAKMFIDCSYEGDLMARAGVSYTTGREANATYNETYNGVQLMTNHQFPDGIDPYKIPGDPRSGLLWGISPATMAAQGSGDQKIQAYNFRICLTSNPANRIAITRPADYDSTRYELLLRYIAKTQPKELKGFLKVDRMPNNKTDINNFGPLSTDMIGMNYAYPEADHATRQQIIKAHEDYTKGLLYFIGHDSRMPAHLRELMLQWGYPKDEYTGNGHWSPQLYVREARRMTGAYVMTQANCEGKVVVEDGVGMAAYTMDSHNCQRIVIKKDGVAMVKNEGNVEIGGFGPYPIAYRAITPKENECSNLLVPVCLSASHIAYGSIRMEPVFMVLAQSAAVAASLAIDSNLSVQQLPVQAVKQRLQKDPLLDGSSPDILLDESDAAKVTVTGSWKKQTRRCYGPSMLLSDSTAQAPAAVRFKPAIPANGTYTVYTYLPKLAGIAASIPVTIRNGAKEQTVVIRPQEISVVGQTSGEWVRLGDFSFTTNGKAFIEISNKTANGVVVADAILLRQKTTLDH